MRTPRVAAPLSLTIRRKLQSAFVSCKSALLASASDLSRCTLAPLPQLRVLLSQAEFDVPGGARMQGQLSEVEGPVYAITLLQDGEDLQLPLLGPLLPGDKPRRGLWGKAVADTFQATGVQFGHIAVKDAMHVSACNWFVKCLILSNV